MKWSLTQKRAFLGFAFVMPWLIGFVFLFATPMIQSIQFSFNKLTIIPTGGYELNFMGWGNFRQALFVDPTFNRTLIDSVVSMLVDVPLILFFSLFSATLLNQKFRGRGIARSIFFLPVILASGAIAAAEAAGLINLIGDSTVASEMGQVGSQFNIISMIRLLDEIGLPMAFTDYIVDAVMRIYDIISRSGVQILIFLAALQAVPGSLYEVAKIEGATPYESFWKITFPMVSPLILTNIIYTVIDSFSASPITKMISTTAFQTQNFGLSAAMSWLFTIVVSLILVIVGIIVSKKVFYNE